MLIIAKDNPISPLSAFFFFFFPPLSSYLEFPNQTNKNLFCFLPGEQELYLMFAQSFVFAVSHPTVDHYRIYIQNSVCR